MVLQLSQPHLDDMRRIVYLRVAREHYPDQDDDSAMTTMVRHNQIPDVFFLDEEGNRCVYRREIDATQPEILAADSTRDHCSRERSVFSAMNPSAQDVRNCIKHQSEDGWNLPRTHPRHLLNFPQEILDIIFGFGVFVASDISLRPSTLDWSFSLDNFPGFGKLTGKLRRYSSQMMLGIEYDTHGQYYTSQMVRYRSINPQLLLTSKGFLQAGLRELYSTTSFQFDDLRCGYALEGPSFIFINANPRTSDQAPTSKLPYPPNMTPDALNLAISHIQNRTPHAILPYALSSDPFLNFLHKIGPSNIAAIENLTFSGLIKFHACKEGWSSSCSGRNCSSDLVGPMFRYIPFIRRLCTGLRSLTIIAQRDLSKDDPQYDAYESGIAGLPGTHNERLDFVLIHGLKSITSLEKLAVFNTPSGVGMKGVLTPYEGAKDTIKFIKRRFWTEGSVFGAQKTVAKAQKVNPVVLSEVVVAEAVSCGYCGEAHDAFVCHNLCNVCGAYGHFRRKYPEKRSLL